MKKDISQSRIILIFILAILILFLYRIPFFLFLTMHLPLTIAILALFILIPKLTERSHYESWLEEYYFSKDGITYKNRRGKDYLFRWEDMEVFRIVKSDDLYLLAMIPSIRIIMDKAILTDMWKYIQEHNIQDLPQRTKNQVEDVILHDSG